MSVATSFKRYFLRGLAVLLPTILTLWILAWGYGLLQEHVSVHVNRGLVKALVWFQRDQGMSEEAMAQYQTALEEIFVQGFAGSTVGLLIAVVAIFLLGAFLASVVGRVLWRVMESMIMSTPVLRRVYPHVKQVTDFVLTPEQKKKSFLHVVAVEYPRKGLWSLGFVTGSGLREIAGADAQGASDGPGAEVSGARQRVRDHGSQGRRDFPGHDGRRSVSIPGQCRRDLAGERAEDAAAGTVCRSGGVATTRMNVDSMKGGQNCFSRSQASTSR